MRNRARSSSRASATILRACGFTPTNARPNRPMRFTPTLTPRAVTSFSAPAAINRTASAAELYSPTSWRMWRSRPSGRDRAAVFN